MNKNYSDDEFIYCERALHSVVADGLSAASVIVITGARQVGKSTFLQRSPVFKDFVYITMDDYNYRNQAIKDPEGLLSLNKNIIIDEIQKTPELLHSVKWMVDNKKNKNKFILSGSSNLLLMKNIGESLAGRAIYYTMLPLTISEISNTIDKPNLLNELINGDINAIEKKTPQKIDCVSYILTGLLPRMISLKKIEDRLRWLEGYVLTYLERDLRELTQVSSLVDFRNFMQVAALQTGRLLNQSEISRDLKISQPSICRYFNLLEVSHLLYKIPAYTKNKLKRLMKSPKYYWFDTGVASYLSGYFDKDTLLQSKDYGFLFENLVYQHLFALTQLISPKPVMHHWRTTTGTEVDFVMEYGRKLIAIEVKASRNVNFRDCANLLEFIKQYDNCQIGIIIYSGNEILKLSERIYSIPFGCL